MKSFLAFFIVCQSAFCADFLTGQAARLVIGQPTFTDNLYQLPPTATVLGGAAGVAYAGDRLFVADSNKTGALPNNHRVLVYTPVSSFPTPTTRLTPPGPPLHSTCSVCIGVPGVVLGQPDYVTATPAVTQNGLYTPTAVASDGNILAVADTDNNRVLIWKSIPSSSNQNADVVVGQVDFTHGSVTQPPSATTLRGPQGVWIANGKLFVADTSNNRVLIYNSIPTGNGAAADVVVGAPDFTTLVPPPVTLFTVPATQTNLSSPTSVTTDGTRLFITDLGHNRVLIWNKVPTSNNQAADVVIGQPDFVSGFSNNSSSTSNLCASNGTDSANAATYPARCGKTLSFPRFALSDGQRFYIADGGNDRVLVYNSVPVTNAPAPDAILGQPDENADNSSSSTDGLATPSALAWDGTNLYVTDPYNLRVLVYTPLGSQLPVAAVRNAASLEIFAQASIAIGGTVAVDNEVDIVIGTVTYKYKAVANDTLAIIVTNLVAQINGTATGSTADANVIAIANTTNPEIILTAKRPGSDGVGTALSASVSSGATVTAAASGSAIAINLANASSIAPGTLISIYGEGLSEQTATADFTQSYLPTALGGSRVYVDGFQTPLLYVSPTQINAQMPYEMQDRSSVSVYVLTEHEGGPPTATNAVGAVIVAANPGLFTFGGTDPRPGIVYHLSSNATGLVSVDGTITAGNVVTVTIAGRAYAYTVLATDGLGTVRDALVNLINTDPDVTAAGTNLYTRIFIQARKSGGAGNGIAYSVSVSTGSTVILTALTSALCCGNSVAGPVTADNPALPGETVYTFATGLGTTTPADGSNTGKIFTGPVNPPTIPVDSILAGGKTANLISATLVPGSVGLFQVIFQLDSGLVTDPLTNLTIAQQLFVSNIVTFPVKKP